VTIQPLTPELVERRFAELEQLVRLGSSLLEAELPMLERGVLERRSLRIEGRVAGFAHSDPRDVRLFASPVAVDRQLGWMPDCWVDPIDGRVVAGGLAVLVAASIDGVHSLDALPRGPSGIVTLRFLLGRPACIDALPVLERHDRQPRLWSCMARDRARVRW
jgi:hypothetical protein